MKNVSMKNRILWTLGSIAALCFFYMVCRFILFDLHGMKEFPFILLILGLIPIFIASFTYSKRVMICSVAGYIISFVIALLFNSDYYEQGTRYNDGWKIWTISYLIIIALGILWEVYAAIIKYRKKRNAHVD